MQAITQNAAELAVAAEPCLSHTVLQCQDDTESIRTVLRAYRGVGNLLAHSNDLTSTLSSDELAELLRSFTTAMDARLLNLTSKLRSTDGALRELRGRRGIDAHAPHLAFEALDQVVHLNFGRDAFAAMHSLAPYAEHAEPGDLSAALQILGENMAARLQIMDDQLDGLHAALGQHEAQAAAAKAVPVAVGSAAQAPEAQP